MSLPEALFARYFTVGLQGALMAALVICLRAAAKRRAPRRLWPALWCVAALRLLVPVRFTGAWALWPSHAGAGLGGGQAAQAAPALPWAQLWLAGACALGIYFLAVYAAALWRLRNAAPCACGQVQAFFQAWPVRRPLRVKTAACATPFTYGVLRPVVVLPAESKWQGQQLFYVLAHERMHIVRFDALRKLLFAAAVCLHWYSPAVWALFILANRDIEFACDEAVVCAQGGAERAPYARALLCTEAQRGAFGPFCSCFSENQWRERMRAIMNKKKASFTAAALAAAVFSAGAVAFAAEPPAAEPKLEGAGASSAVSGACGKRRRRQLCAGAGFGQKPGERRDGYGQHARWQSAGAERSFQQCAGRKRAGAAVSPDRGRQSRIKFRQVRKAPGGRPLGGPPAFYMLI